MDPNQQFAVCLLARENFVALVSTFQLVGSFA